MDALKRASTDSSGMGKPIAAKLSVVKALPDSGNSADPDADMDSDVGGMDTDMDEDKENQQNAMIVDALQTNFPSVYDKIMKMLPSDDASSAASPSATDGFPSGDAAQAM
jgi:hypothetical protein